MDLIEENIELPRGPNGLGFNIRGGIDVPHLKNDHGIFVTKIRDIGTAYEDGRLKEGDKILEVNGEDLRNVSHNEAVQVFLKAGGNVKMLVQHNAEAFYKKKLKDFELLDKELNQKAKEATENSSSSRIWTAIGVSVVVIAGSLFLAKKYNKLPDLLNIKLPTSWSS
ncbi:synaptojanin-2-binding protein-like [Mytilus trossulus]|uniref:synaptojanin-2-binding protein-like n=1 Tax=Mytilus trossulus TaxID=6551 RepID=UPI0030040A2D